MDSTTGDEERYSAAEEAFLSAIRSGAERDVLTELADAVAVEAARWNRYAYELLHASSGEQRDELDAITERTEVLGGLWADIAGAFHGRPAKRDG